MLEILWGYKTQAIFDVWSIEHFLTGISVGIFVLKSNHKSLGEILSTVKDLFHPKRLEILKYKYDLIFLLFIAYAWETLEHYLETGVGGGLGGILVSRSRVLAKSTFSRPFNAGTGLFIRKKISSGSVASSNTFITLANITYFSFSTQHVSATMVLNPNTLLG